jgi:pimeloyl-ACP methyl ester carboxylesterase
VVAPLPDETGPRVTADTLTPLAAVRTSVDHIDIQFDEAIDPASFSSADLIVLVGPRGAITPTGDPVALDGTNTSFRISFDRQEASGAYTITLGPDVLDAVGIPMNQDSDGQNGEPADDQFTATFQLVRTPTIVVPGIFGSLPTNIRFTGSSTTHVLQLNRIRRDLRSFLVAQGAFDPAALGPEPLARAYDEVLDRLENRGFTRCRLPRPTNARGQVSNCESNADLFFAAYDWRLPVLVSPANPQQLLWDGDGQFESAVEYLDFWIDLAKTNWIERHGSADGFAVNIVAHSMGGLVARAYIEEAAEAGQTAEPVNHLIMLGTPNHGSVAVWQFFDPTTRLSATAFSGCSTVASVANAIIGADSDPCLRSIVAEAMRMRDRRLHLRRGTSRAVDVVQSLQDLVPTFPFLRRLDSTVTELPETNHLLARLNPSTDDLTAATDVLLIGTDNRDTPIVAEVIRERSIFTGLRRITTLHFETRPLGDGRVLFDRIPEFTNPVGLVLPAADIQSIAVRTVAHGNLPRNDGILCRVFEELSLYSGRPCA